MPFAPLPGYGSYYDATANQTGDNPYVSSTQSGSGASSQQYQGDGSQPQYSTPSGYDSWSTQSRQGYGSNPQQTYNSWREPNGQSNQYDYRRDASAYATQAAAGNQNYYGSAQPASSPTSQSMSGLNNLASASGLEDQRLTSRAQQSSSKYSAAPISLTPNGAQSPMRPKQSYSNQQNSSNAGQDSTPGGEREMTLTTESKNLKTASQNLAISAAQALAGIVNSRRYQSPNTPQQISPPTMSAANATQRSNSPYTAPSLNQVHKRVPSTQSQRRPAQSSNGAIPSLSANSASSVPATKPRQSHGRASSQSKHSAASQKTSMSNLVTTTEDTTPATAATETMPAYIDPTQVFNPYHREHERRRKEAAETEARKQAENAAVAAKAKEAQTQSQKEKSSAKSNRPPVSTSHQTTSAPPADEGGMAAEMMRMMEKMKEFRQQDPATFQKLWEELRKPGASNATSAAVQSPSLRISQPQGVPSQAASTAVPATTVAPSPSVAASTPTVAPSPSLTASAHTAGEGSIKELGGLQGPQWKGSKPPPHATTASPYAPPNGYKVVVENNEESLPDLGRFPAERRTRALHVQMTSPNNGQVPAAPSGAFPTPGLVINGAAAPPTAPVPAQPLPDHTASGGVEWPKGNHGAVANATVDALKSVPENASVQISTDEIQAILDQNPSYSQLCDLLEKKGLTLNRGRFARQLLTTVPDLKQPQKAKVPPKAPRPMPPINFNGYPPPPMLVHGPPASNQFRVISTLGAVKAEHPQGQKTSKQKKNSMSAAKRGPPPGPKEAMARKRDFSELVDLTQLSDNDDYVLSSKHRRLDSPSPEPDPFEKYQLEAKMQPPVLMSKVPFSANPIDLPQGAPLRFNPVQTYKAAPPPPPPPSLPKKTILAKLVNKGEALKKSYYDPKTVARDILIAAGRHPQERPLNAHMASLLGKHIDLDSDLSTFDWDAVDPGGPPMPRVQYVDIPAAPPRFRLGQRSNRPRRLHLLNKGKRQNTADGDSVSTTAATSPPGPQFTKLKRYSGRAHPPRDAVREQVEPKPSHLRETHVVDDESSPARAVTPQKQKVSTASTDPSPQERSPRSSSHHQGESMGSESPTGQSFPSGRPRGRPPGSKNKHPSVAAMKSTTRISAMPQVEVPIRSSSPQGLPTFKCRWKGPCKTELHSLDTLRKHISRVHRPSDEEIEVQGFVCWWRKCQSLTTDKEENWVPTQRFATAEEWMEHINDVHLHKVAMKLGDGPNTTQIGKLKILPFNVTQFRFDPQSSEANARTRPYLDSQTLAEDKARYLSDAKGRITTPAVTAKGNQDLPQDAMGLTKPVGDEAGDAAQKAFIRAHRQEKINPKSTAEETLRAMQARKANIGPGIDRGGCTLVNDARRATFVQNPGIRRVVEADY